MDTRSDNDISSGADAHSGEDSSREEAPKLDCALAKDGVNYPVRVPVSTPWNEFLPIVARELGVKREEITLSYRFSSFTASENSEALRTQDHYQTMITRAKDFLTGKQKVRGGKCFRVHLKPIFKNHPPTSATVADPSEKRGEKVSCTLPWLAVVIVT